LFCLTLIQGEGSKRFLMDIKPIEPFVFYSSLHLVELTGVRASTLMELAQHLREVNGSCIYHHTHQFVQQHQYLAPEPANDFACWASDTLGDERLGEALAAIDIMEHPSIRSIREALIKVIEDSLKNRPRLKGIFAPEGEEFDFLKSVSFVFPTGYKATSLEEFADCISRISLYSIYFHMFEARLRLERPTNDFSNWLAASLGEDSLAAKLAQIDPYTQTGEGIRASTLKILNKRIAVLRSAGNGNA